MSGSLLKKMRGIACLSRKGVGRLLLGGIGVEQERVCPEEADPGRGPEEDEFVGNGEYVRPESRYIARGR